MYLFMVYLLVCTCTGWLDCAFVCCLFFGALCARLVCVCVILCAFSTVVCDLVCACLRMYVYVSVYVCFLVFVCIC